MKQILLVIYDKKQNRIYNKVFMNGMDIVKKKGKLKDILVHRNYSNVIKW